MTTIAAEWRNGKGEMASDSLVTWGSVPAETQKIFRVRGALVGIVGYLPNALKFVEWCEKGAKRHEPPEFCEDPEDSKDSHFSVIILDRNGLFWCDNDLQFVRLPDLWAAGSGEQAALAALRHGLDVTAAIEMAITVDNESGGKVQHQVLDPL